MSAIPEHDDVTREEAPSEEEISSDHEVLSEHEASSEHDDLPEHEASSDHKVLPEHEASSEQEVFFEREIFPEQDDTTNRAKLDTLHVPYQRNPFFCGREDVLQQLHKQFISNQDMEAIRQQAIIGLSGAGKTQVALEYAYRYQQDYTYIFWINAASEQTILADYMTIASVSGVRLETQYTQESTQTAKAWLTKQKNWLLIFDHADNLAALHKYIPEGSTGGHILYIMNRPPYSKTMQLVELPQLETEAATLLLLRRASILTRADGIEQAPLQILTGAKAIISALGTFPLAVEQAAAYIEATGCGLARYLYLHEKQCQALADRRKHLSTEHAEPAIATCVLSFQSIERSSPAAAELLCLCAFLDTDAISKELITNGATMLGPVLSTEASKPADLDQLIESLCLFALVQQYSDEKQFSIHPLIQTILKNEMNQETQQEWTERAIAAVDKAFPGAEASWQVYQPYLQQVEACVRLIDYYQVASFEATKLLNNAALALKEHKQYEQAGPLFARALAIEEKIAGPEHPTTAITLNNLATLYQAQSKYEKAEPYYRRALAIWELEPGQEYPALTVGYDNLATLYQALGKYEYVESLRQHALVITEQVWGMIAPETANCLNNLANFYHTQGNYEQAETFYRRSLVILLKIVGTDHPAAATSLNNLANLYRNWGKDQQAGPLLHRALLIREKVLGPEHLETASSLSDLANLYQNWGHYEQAEKFLLRALAIVEKALGTQHSQVALTLSQLAQCYRRQEKYEQAETLLQRTLSIDEIVYGSQHLIVAADLESYADFLWQVERPEEAKLFQERAQVIREQTANPA